MKANNDQIKHILFFGFIIFIVTGCGSYERIGDLTMISNRNVDSDKEYVLIKRDVESKAKAKNNDPLEIAIYNITESYKGEYLKNVKIYLKSNGKKLKVKGDVWGLKSTRVNVKSSVTKDVKFEIGDSVTFNNSGSIKEGKIIGINQKGAIIEYKNLFGKLKKKEIEFDKLTKIEKK